MSKRNYNLSLVEKQNFLIEHFVYEVNQLNYAFSKLVSLENGEILKDIDFEKNMAINAMLLHGRNLEEFLYDKDKSYYSRAGHFVDDWEKMRIARTEALENLKNRASNEITHLTYKRIYDDKAEKKLWNYRVVFQDFMNLINYFINKLPSEYDDCMSVLKSNINRL